MPASSSEPATGDPRAAAAVELEVEVLWVDGMRGR